jgi:dihydrofolate synthase / folylpolyglutamate synthase
MSRFQTLTEWLAWQETLHPTTIELGLVRVSQVWQQLYSHAFPATVITVAGTNGKGSTVAMLAAIYRAAGYRVATYTSPHLLRYNERIVIHGEPVSDEALCEAFDRVDRARADVSLTYFEFGTLAALWLFTQTPLDIVILEVGMGGRLDAVNIIDADVAVITAIDLDHQEWLGRDRESIGLEKAGILRRGRAGVCSDPLLPATVSDYARQLGAPLWRLTHEYDYAVEGGSWRWWSQQAQRPGLPRLALTGQHQLQNAAGVLMAVELLQTKHPVSQAHLRAGLLTARVPGRFQMIPGEITTVLDVAHNPAGAQVLAATLAAQTSRCGRTLAVFTALADKDIDGLIQPLHEIVEAWYVAPVQSARSRSVQELSAAVARHQSPAAIYGATSIGDAYRQARAAADAGDWIVVFGSFYAVAEVVKILNG